MEKINFTKEQREEIKKRYINNFENQLSICKDFNCGHKVITRILKEEKVYMNYSTRRKFLFKNNKLNVYKINFSNRQKNEILNRYLNNFENPEKIRKNFNCSTGIIVRILKEEEVWKNSKERRKELIVNYHLTS